MHFTRTEDTHEWFDKWGTASLIKCLLLNGFCLLRYKRTLIECCFMVLYCLKLTGHIAYETKVGYVKESQGKHVWTLAVPYKILILVSRWTSIALMITSAGLCFYLPLRAHACFCAPASLLNSTEACLDTFASAPLYSFCMPQWTVHSSKYVTCTAQGRFWQPSWTLSTTTINIT